MWWFIYDNTACKEKKKKTAKQMYLMYLTIIVKLVNDKDKIFVFIIFEKNLQF